MKQWRNLLAVSCLSLALHSTALSQWLDEGEFSRGVLAYKLRQVKNQFETAVAQFSMRTEVEWNAKELKRGALYTNIESLETEFRNGGYCPDLLDEKILSIRKKIRLILAGQKQIGADQNTVGGQAPEVAPGSRIRRSLWPALTRLAALDSRFNEKGSVLHQLSV